MGRQAARALCLVVCITFVGSGCRKDEPQVVVLRETTTDSPPAVEAEADEGVPELNVPDSCLVAFGLMRKDAASAGMEFYYARFHEHEGRWHAALITGIPQSECDVSLVRVDEDGEDWMTAPVVMDEGGWPQVDVDSVEHEWNVPADTVREWLGEADRFLETSRDSEGTLLPMPGL